MEILCVLPSFSEVHKKEEHWRKNITEQSEWCYFLKVFHCLLSSFAWNIPILSWLDVNACHTVPILLSVQHPLLLLAAHHTGFMLVLWRVLIIVLIQASLLQYTTVTSMFVFLTAFSDLNENIKCRCFVESCFLSCGVLLSFWLQVWVGIMALSHLRGWGTFNFLGMVHYFLFSFKMTRDEGEEIFPLLLRSW